MLPQIVLGPPGCGKTTTLLNMVDEELEAGVPPERIGFLTFTRQAAKEARDRACARFGFPKTRLPYFRTIHSLCFSALGLTSSDVLTGNKLKDFGEWIGAPVSASLNFEEGSMAGFELGDRCLHINNLARVKGLSLRQQYDLNCDDLDWHLVERVARGLEEYKRQKHLIDFTHMLQLFVDSDWRARIDVLYVDEAQDLSLLQWRVIEKLARHAQRVVIAGDDDQSIFRWAGAAVDHFVTLPGQVKVLGQSWRVPQAIQGLAHEVIGRVRARRPKQWAPRPEAGRVRRVQSLDEVDLGTGDDVLVLSRNSAYLRKEAANLLRSEGVLYSYRGEQSVKPELVQAILDWEHLRKGDTVPVRQAERIYEYMGVGTSIQKGFKKLPQHQDREAEVSILDLQNHAGLQTTGIWHEAMDRLPAEDRAYMIKALKRGEKFTRNPTVRLSTIHGSKGGEADHVVLVRDMAFRTYKEMEQSPEDEARCFYVAATRAKQTLTIVAPQTKRSYDI